MSCMSLKIRASVHDVAVLGALLRFVVRRDWNFAKSGKPAAIFQKLYRSEDPAKDRHRPKAT